MQKKGISERKLAAIMFTDIVGYTALMGKDSKKAMELVRKSKEIQKPLVEKYHGKWIKEMGDGALAQFSAALDAVNCAVEIQELARAKFDGKLRIGIHSGDITIENEDVFGDGVNVASRLESIADPGGIYISDAIEKAIRGQTEIQTIYLGESQLKNVDYGVRTYAIQGIGLPVPKIDENKKLSGHFWAEVQRREVIRAGMTYIVISLLLVLLVSYSQSLIILPSWSSTALISILVIFFPVALYLAWTFEYSPEGFVRTTSEQSWRNPLKASQRKPLTGNIIIVGLLVIILFMYFYPKYIQSETVPTNSDPGSSFSKKSIAVLPFKNLSGNEDNLYFSDGVMEAILNNLSRIRDLKVVSRTSVEKYRNQNKSIKEIAKELEVANILEGSVQRIGDEVRITAQLISAEDDEHIWADNYDRHLTDIFSIQSEIAQTIADNLEVIMTMEERESIKNAPTSNLKAYELFLKVRHHDANSEEEILKDIDLCEQAIGLDPDFGLAYAFKGNLMTDLSFYGYPKSIWCDSAMILQDIAIRKDPKAWEPYLIKSLIYDAIHDDREVLKNLSIVIDLNPNLAFAYHLLGQYSLRQDEYEQAIDYLLKSASLIGREDDQANSYERYGYFLYELDIKQSYENFKKSYQSNPENIGVLPQLLNCARYFKEYDKALEYAIEYQKQRPDLLNAKNLVAESYLILKQFDMAEKKYEEMTSESDQFKNDYMIYPFTHRLGYAMMMNGNEKEGISIMEAYRDTLISAINRQEIKAYAFGDYYDLALIYAALKNKEEAYKWLNMARENETKGAFYRIDFLICDPMLNNLREDPEFKKILEDKLKEKEEIKNIFYNKLALYHANNELKWLSSR